MKTINELLGDLHNKLVTELLRRIQAGEATDKDLDIARKMLIDNGIQATPQASPNLLKLDELVGELPDETERSLKLA